jgi:hypothetical protein
MDAVFKFLFKYPLLVFQQGDFTLGASRPVLVSCGVRRRGGALT